MNIHELFPSKYAQPEDLKGKTVLATINTFTIVPTHNPTVKMPVISFIGAKKPIILKQTLTFDIGKIHGEETDLWKGRKIMLYAELVKGRLAFRAKAVKPHDMAANHTPIAQEGGVE
jgi:hypothetical protein